jgi:catechol 2,3-dioxygenase-like lactoylglutathione lyase family enzyme
MTSGDVDGLTFRKPRPEEDGMADTGTATHITAVGTVIVTVSDQDSGIEFFTEKLGFEKRSDSAYGDGQRWVDVAPPGAATTVAVVPPMAGNTAGGDTGVAFATDDIDADHAALRERGVDVDDEVMRMGDPVPPMFFFRDPDGNRYLIVQTQG